MSWQDITAESYTLGCVLFSGFMYFFSHFNEFVKKVKDLYQFYVLFF